MSPNLLSSKLHLTPPPQTEEDKLTWIRLLRSSRVGIATFFRLMGEHGSAQAALDALPDIAAQAGVKNYTTFPLQAAQDEAERAAIAGAQMVTWGAPDYPELLSQISDPPPFFWALGDKTVLSRPMVALIGARNASSVGIRMARKLSHELAEAGFCVVSGLARGIDAAAHLAALKAGQTTAVMAGGVDVIYPKENKELANDIAENGLRMSEQPMGLSPFARHFPRRNRLISGLAHAVVVIEAAAKSGSLITARNALDQGRDVLAVPGHPFDARASGCNFLIRDGAVLVRGAQDVIDAIGPLPPSPGEHAPPSPTQPRPTQPSPRPASQRSLQDIAQLHRRILERLGPSPLSEDQLIRDISDDGGLSSGDILPELVHLELEGRISRQPGGLLSKLQH